LQYNLTNLVHKPNLVIPKVPHFRSNALSMKEFQFPMGYTRNPSSALAQYLDNLINLYHEAHDLAALSLSGLKRRHLFTAKLGAATCNGRFTRMDASNLAYINLDVTRTAKNAYLLHRSDVITLACIRFEIFTVLQLFEKPERFHISAPKALVNHELPNGLDPLSIKSDGSIRSEFSQSPERARITYAAATAAQDSSSSMKTSAVAQSNSRKRRSSSPDQPESEITAFESMDLDYPRLCDA
jgi:hypothetical protein